MDGFATSKAVGENGVGAGRAGGQFEAGIELIAIGSSEGDFLGSGFARKQERLESGEGLVGG